MSEGGAVDCDRSRRARCTCSRSGSRLSEKSLDGGSTWSVPARAAELVHPRGVALEPSTQRDEDPPPLQGLLRAACDPLRPSALAGTVRPGHGRIAGRPGGARRSVQRATARSYAHAAGATRRAHAATGRGRRCSRQRAHRVLRRRDRADAVAAWPSAGRDTSSTRTTRRRRTWVRRGAGRWWRLRVAGTRRDRASRHSTRRTPLIGVPRAVQRARRGRSRAPLAGAARRRALARADSPAASRGPDRGRGDTGYAWLRDGAADPRADRR